MHWSEFHKVQSTEGAMSERARVLNQLEGSHRLVKELVGDVLDDEARRGPAANLSPITWQVGHLAFADATFGRHARSAYIVPENYADLFKTGTGGHARYPEFNEVLEAFGASHRMLVQLAGEADLASPMTILPGRSIRSVRCSSSSALTGATTQERSERFAVCSASLGSSDRQEPDESFYIPAERRSSPSAYSTASGHAIWL